MSTTSRELLDHATALPQGSEVERRTKISRLYYALYTHAVEFHDMLDSKGILLKSQVGVHKQLSQKLTNPTVTDPTWVELSRQMGTKQSLAHELRVKADYELDEELPVTDVVKCQRYVTSGIAIPLPKKAAA